MQEIRKNKYYENNNLLKQSKTASLQLPAKGEASNTAKFIVVCILAMFAENSASSGAIMPPTAYPKSEQYHANQNMNLNLRKVRGFC